MNSKKLERLLDDFYIVSGMEISILDPDFHTVASSRHKGESFCSYIHRWQQTFDVCRGSDMEWLDRVARSGEAALYTCPFGVTEAILPVVRNERVIAYIISAMGIGDREVAAALTLGRVPEISEVDLGEIICRSRTLTDREAKAYFNTLAMLAEHIAGDTTIIEGEESLGTLTKRYIKSNLARKLTLTDIACSLHCSTVTLTNRFKAEFGITVVEYITKKRMELAEKLLLSTDEPLREIATLTGFGDVEYFSRTFKKHHGISPAAWRRMNR